MTTEESLAKLRNLKTLLVKYEQLKERRQAISDERAKARSRAASKATKPEYSTPESDAFYKKHVRHYSKLFTVLKVILCVAAGGVYVSLCVKLVKAILPSEVTNATVTGQILHLKILLLFPLLATWLIWIGEWLKPTLVFCIISAICFWRVFTVNNIYPFYPVALLCILLASIVFVIISAFFDDDTLSKKHAHELEQIKKKEKAKYDADLEKYFAQQSEFETAFDSSDTAKRFDAQYDQCSDEQDQIQQKIDECDFLSDDDRWDAELVDFVINKISSRRADSIKEALKAYDEEKRRASDAAWAERMRRYDEDIQKINARAEQNRKEILEDYRREAAAEAEERRQWEAYQREKREDEDRARALEELKKIGDALNK